MANPYDEVLGGKSQDQAASPYDAALSDDLQKLETLTRQRSMQAAMMSAGEAKRNKQLSDRVKLPTDLIGAVPEYVEQSVKAQDIQNNLSMFPPDQQRWFLENQNLESLQDDLPRLNALAKAIDNREWYDQTAYERNVKAPVARGLMAVKQAVNRYQIGNALTQIPQAQKLLDTIESAGYDDPQKWYDENQSSLTRDDYAMVEQFSSMNADDLRNYIQDLKKGIPTDISDYTMAEKVMQNIPMDPDMPQGKGAIDTIVHLFTENPGAIPRETITSLVQSSPALAMGYLTGGGSALATMGAAGAGSFLVEEPAKLAEVMRDEGVDLTDPDQVYAAFTNPELMAKAQDKAFKKAAGTAGVDALMAFVGGRMLMPSRVGGRTLTQAERNLGNQLAQVPLQAAGEGAGEALGQYAAEGRVDAGEVALETIIGGATGPVEVLAYGAQHYRRGKAAKEYLSSIAELANEARKGNATEEQVREFIANAKQRGPVSELYIDAQKFSDILEQGGLNPEDIVARMPSVTEQYYEAQAIGGDLAITLEDFAAVLADTGVADQLTSASRVDPNGYSAEDADAWIQGEGKQALERYLSFDPAESQAPIRTISEDIVGQLVSIGYDQSIAETEAERMATTFTRIAEMAGMDPMQVYEKYGPKIQRPESEASRKVRGTTQLDNMLDRLRAGDIPSQADIFGQNLSEFLREQGGLQDQGGELAAIDADVGRRAFESKLIQETGMTLDDAAEKAVEAGYMQERDPNLLLDLINREIRGEPVYAAGSANDKLRALADDLAMLDDELRRRGLDIGSLSNDEIIQALTEQDQQQAGESVGLDQPGTPAFDAWFGDSKVVDENGQPLVVYHGTEADFTAFKNSRSDVGMHFGTTGQAEDRLDFMREGGRRPDEGMRTIPVYLSIKNPLRLIDLGAWNKDTMDYALIEKFPADAARIRSLKTTKQIRDYIKSKGYDGIVYRNTGEVAGSAEYRERVSSAKERMNNVFPKNKSSFSPEDQKVPEYVEYSNAMKDYADFRERNGEDSYIAFDPTQIKSAIGNRGTYDPNDPNILNQAAAEGYAGDNRGEAAEWLAAVAKGLDMSDAARMQRARDMGFDNGSFFHGTDENFTEFDPSAQRSSSTKGHYFTGISGDPDSAVSVASGYGDVGEYRLRLGRHMDLRDDGNLDTINAVREIWKKYEDAPTVDTTSISDISDIEWSEDSQEIIDKINAAVDDDANDLDSFDWVEDAVEKGVITSDEMDALNTEHQRQEFDDYLRLISSPDGYNEYAGPQFRDSFIDNLIAEGWDSVTFYDDAPGGGIEPSTVIFDPKNIRSVNAAFDPDLSDSTNILNQDQPAADIATAVRPAEAAAQRREAMAAEVGLAADVAEAVHQGADTDQLTGLYHSDEVAPAIERALASNEGWKYAEADMGSLSAVNKALGSNAEANRFIKAVADAYQNAFDGAPVFRRGGGRFAALAPEGFDVAAAQARVDADVATIIEEFNLSDLADSARLYQGASDIGQFTDVDGVTKAAQNEIESKKPEDKENVERIEAFQARAASPEGQPAGAAKRAAEASRRSGDEKRAGSDREAEAARSALTVEAGDVVYQPAGLIPSPDDFRNARYEAQAGELGLTQPQAERFRHVTKRDTLLPEFFTDADRKETMQSALDLVTETDAPAAYASLDISNLGGMTDILGRATADKVFVEMSRIALRSLQSLDGVDVIPFRHGGDEISFVVVGADSAQVKAKLQQATLDAQRYVNAIGIDAIPHRKYPNDRNKDGAGLYPGVREILPNDSIEAVEQDADRISEANKYKGKPKVGGEKLSLVKPDANTRIKDILFQSESLAGQPQTPADLFVAHNLSADNLRHALDLGGLAAPSLAIARSGISEFSGFGEITLLADPAMLGSSKARTFDADVYTPRHPRAEYDFKKEPLDDLTTKINDLPGVEMIDLDRLSRDGARQFLYEDGPKLLFLTEKGIAPKAKKKKASALVKKFAVSDIGIFALPNNPEFVAAVQKQSEKSLAKIKDLDADKGERYEDIWFNEDGSVKDSVVRDEMYRVQAYRESGGIDTSAMRSAIATKMRNKKLAAEYEKWATAEFNKLVHKAKIFKGFTNSGNRRYTDYNLENVVKEMTSKLQGGESFNYGAGSVRSAFANEMKSIAAVQKRRDQIVSGNDFQAIKEQANDRLIAALEELKPAYKYDANGWGYLDDASSAIAEGPKGWREAFNLDDDSRKVITDLIEYLRGLPTEYFETKVQRAVDLSEFKYAIVPRGTDPELVRALTDKGVEIKTYKNGDESDRARVVGRQKDILFQPAYHGTPHRFDRFSLSAMGTGEGAQAYGWGLYFAGKRAVAEWYRDALSGEVFRVADGGIFNPDSLEHMNVRSAARRGDLDAAISKARTISEGGSPVAALAANDLSILEDIKSRGGLEEEAGNLYKVDIPEDSELLDWDAPLSDQPESIKEKLRKASIESRKVSDIPRNELIGILESMDSNNVYNDADATEEYGSPMTDADLLEAAEALDVQNYLDSISRVISGLEENADGRWLMRALENYFGGISGGSAMSNDAKRQASMFLNDLGISGLRYLDADSRIDSADGKTRNYVIWDEDVVTIQAVNDELVQARELEQRGGKAVNRGSFFYDAMNKAVIQLGEASDLTTLTHESYHLFLDVMNDLALDNKQIAGEIEKVRNWLSANPADMRRDAMKYAKDAGEKAIADQIQSMTDEQLAAFYQSANLSLREMPSHGAERYMTIAGLEYFARGGEMYMLEGRSPAPEMNGMFRRMKQWFLQVYKSAKALKVNLSDDIRGLFDRMLATDEQIAQAADLAGYGTALTDVAGLSWTDEERERVARLTGEAREQAERALMREQIRDMQKIHQKWWDDERERVRREVLDELNKTPAYQARQMLTAARRADGSPLPAGVEQIKLDRKMLADEFGADYIKRLPSPKNPGNRAPQYTYAREGGVDPTVVARQYGFDSARALVEALIDSRPVDAYVESLVDGEMRRLYPDINMTDEAAQVALEAVYNDKRAQVMLAELRKLESKVGAPETIPQLFRNKAADVVRGKAIKDIRPDLYQRKAATFEREALREAMAGNYEEALAAKQRALMHHYLYKESVKARKEAESIYDYAKRLQKKPAQERIGKAGADYLERINEILSRYEFRRVSLAALARRQRLIDWVAAKQADGEHVDIPQSVLDRAEAVNWRSVSIDELMAARDALKNLEHTARVKNRLLADKNKRELQEVVNGVVAQIDKTQGKKRGKRFFQQKKLVEAAREAGHDYAAIALNMDSILRELDGWEDLGPVYDAIKRPIDEASRNVLPAMQEEYGNKLASLYNQFFSRKEQREMVKGKWVELRGRGWISREQAISVGLNWGNEYNREAVMAGIASAEDRLSEIEVRRILDSLTKNDMDFIQSVWDMMDHDLWPQVKAAQERRTGIAPEKVKATPVVTKHGVYRGGYYPVKFDRELGWRVTAQEADEMAQQVRMGGFAKAQTSRGHTEARVGTGGNPLKLDLSVLHGHMNQVLTDLALGDAINDVARVANHRDFVAAMERSGNTWAVRAIDSWLKDVAAQEVTGSDILSKFARRVRVGFTISKLGWNMGTILLQPSGLFQSLPDVGYGNMARAIADVSRGTWNGDGSIFNQVRQRSAFMRTRAASFNKDIDATMQAMKGSGWMEAAMEHIPLVKNLAGGMGPQKASEMVKNSLMGGIVAIQQVVDTIVWLGAYEKGKSMFESDADAVQYADNVVARTQASGIFSDRTAFERGTLNNNTRQAEFVRLWTVLGSYMFAKANIAYEKTRSTSFRDPAQILKWAHDMTLLYIMEVIFIGLLRSTLPDDDDDESKAGFLVKEAGAGVLAGMPLVRDAASVMQGFQGGGALGGFWDQIGRLSVQINQGEVDAALLKSLNNAGGTIFKYPSGQINRTFDAMWRDMNGEDVGVMDYLMWRQED